MGLALAPADAAVLRQKLADWWADPVLFVREVFGVEPQRWQARVLVAFVRNRRVAMTACKGPGKTCVLAWCVWLFLLTQPHANVAATSISGDNLRDGLWKELAKWQARSPLLQRTFEWQKERIVAREAPGHWWASARQWSKSADATQQANTLAGLHADAMLFVIDEAGGVPQAVAATAEAALASGHTVRFLMAGNPTQTDGPLYEAATAQRDKWEVFHITGDPDDPERSPNVSVEWAREQIDMYGRDNPWVLVNVFGLFPPSSLNTLIGPDEVQAAFARALRDEDFAHQQKRLGIDCARFGDDRTVIFPRQGLQAFEPTVLRGKRGTEIAAVAATLKARWGGEAEFVDDTGGWGQSTIDTLYASGHSPIRVQFHAPANDRRYKNRRVEMWLEMVAWIRRGGALPNIPGLQKELTTPTYWFENGVYVLEDKKQIKARLGSSPDLADGLALTFAMAEMPTMIDGRTGLPMELGRRTQTDWNPIERENWAA